MLIKVLTLYFLVGTINCGHHDERIPQPIKDWGQSIISKCFKESGTTNEDLQDIDMENFPQNLRCYTTCMLREGGWLKKGTQEFDRDFIFTEAIAFAPVMGKAFDECTKVPAGPEECDIGYNMHYCYWKLEPEKFAIL